MSGPSSKNNNQPVDLDASAPSHIIGSATLYASDGSLARSCSGKMTEESAKVLYQMLIETGTILEGTKEKLKRITVGFSGLSYAVTVATDGFVYVVQMQS